LIEVDTENFLFLAFLFCRYKVIPVSKGVPRVVTQITLDARRDKKIHLGDKIASVAEYLSIKE
jgi:uncharacterized protein YqgV (UPF0045/DUF77 family)